MSGQGSAGRILTEDDLGEVEPAPRRARLRWWREILVIGAFYALYSLIRDIHGSNTDALTRATANAYHIVNAERFLHIFDEERIQSWFIHHVDFMRFWDDFYGTVHFAAVVTVLVVLFFRFPSRYRFWRNTLAIATALALVGFAWFPLLPPRMLPPSYGFVDSLRVIGGLWDFQDGGVNGVSNQLAAMPSLHTAWSVWCAIALVGMVRPWWGKILLFLYPCATVFCIVITANHYFTDALGGLFVLGVGYGGAQLISRAGDRWGGLWRGWWRSRPAPTTVRLR